MIKPNREPTKEESESVKDIIMKLEYVCNGKPINDIIIGLINFICLIAIDENISKERFLTAVENTYEYLRQNLNQ